MKPNLSRLTTILSTMRPSKSVHENHFVMDWLVPTLGTLKTLPRIDNYGNIYVVVGDNPVTMFSSHTDTVHDTGGNQKLEYDNALHHLFPANKKFSGCLGADDGTGIWLMLHMIENGVPGLYTFHRDEECGGGGSVYGAKDENNLLKNIKHCIAFDRKGYKDIITHQGGVRTCSNEFAKALSKYLPGFEACDGGSFTDSKNYRGVIPECTNLSVGYFNQHGPNEYQDVKFAVQLANQLCKVPWHELPAARKAEIEAPTWEHYSYYKHLQAHPAALETAELLKWVMKHPFSAAILLSYYEVTNDDLQDAEYDAAFSHRQMVVQRTDDVRAVPASSKKEVPGQTPIPGKRSDEPRASDAQSRGTIHKGGNKRTTKGTKPAKSRTL